MKFEKDYSFWLYLFGLAAATAGFSVFYNSDTIMFAVFGLVHVLMIIGSIILDRNIFLVFGAVGTIEFLGRMSYKYFRGDLLFPLSLTLVGL
jgi:hypothetical protein